MPITLRWGSSWSRPGHKSGRSEVLPQAVGQHLSSWGSPGAQGALSEQPQVPGGRVLGQGRERSRCSSSPSASGPSFCDSEQAAFLFYQCFKAAFVFECQWDLSVGA